AALADARADRVLTARPAEPEKALSFAGLADLLEGVEPELYAGLPPPQRVALDAALLRGEEVPAPDPRAVSTAALSLIRALAATQQLLRRRLERSYQRPTLLRLHQASGGNPFFALEIARALGTSELRPNEPLPVPPDVRSLVRRRITRLPPATRRALFRAAALAQPTASRLG